MGGVMTSGAEVAAYDTGWIERYEALLRRGVNDAERFYPGAEEGNPCPLDDYDPVVSPRPGMITKGTRLATMGSCFAGEIKKWLLANGYSFVQREAHKGEPASAGSAAYGNVYTTQMIRQNMEHALGLWAPAEACWRRGVLLTDPYRAGIGWSSEREMIAERAEHARAVREVLAEAEVFILTMGLSESFRSRSDGSAFYRFPPRSNFDPAKHEPHWYSVDENLDNLEIAYDLLRSVNPGVRLVVTLSPVPLRASMHPMGAVVGDEISKATLRVALARFCEAHPEVVYFPSFEMVRKLTRHSPYELDNRHVRREMVARIMRTFMTNYGDLTPERAARDAEAHRFRAAGSLEATFRGMYARERLQRVLEVARPGRIALFGGGRHTHELLAISDLDAEARGRIVVLDDAPAVREIVGVPVRSPREIDANDIAAVLVSSEAHEEALAARAQEWVSQAGASSRVPIERFYAGLPKGPYAKYDRVEWFV